MSIRSSEEGPKNSDSLMLFAQVLTMSSMLWDTGRAQTFEARWTYLNLATTPGGLTAIHKYKLFDPIFRIGTRQFDGNPSFVSVRRSVETAV